MGLTQEWIGTFLNQGLMDTKAKSMEEDWLKKFKGVREKVKIMFLNFTNSSVF